MAEWQSGYAADCKSVDLGSTPGSASIHYYYPARVAELVDAADLKSADHCDRAGSIPALGTIYMFINVQRHPPGWCFCLCVKGFKAIRDFWRPFTSKTIGGILGGT